MKFKYSKFLFCFSLAIVITCLAYYFSGDILSLLIPRHNYDVILRETTNFGIRNLERRMALLLGIIPLVSFFVWWIAKMNNFKKLVGAISLTYLLTAIAITTRYLMLNAVFRAWTARTGEYAAVNVNFEDLNYPLFILLGILAGAILSFFIFRNRRRERKG